MTDPKIPIAAAKPAAPKSAHVKPAADPEVLDKNDEEAVDALEKMAAKNPGVFAALMNRLMSSPTLGVMGKTNVHSAKMAAKGRAGRLLLDRVRNNLIRPMLPEQHRGVLDNKLVRGALDLVVGNAMLFLCVEFEDKLPEKIRPYARVIAECAMYSGYQDTFGAFDIEDIFGKVISGDLFATFKGFVDDKAA